MKFVYHPDHLGSASFVTNENGAVCQHLQYLPFGEIFVIQRNSEFDTRYKFTAKELDNESSYTYFGARYYDSDLSVWLSVDPMSDKYPSTSAYMYCLGNPLKLTDPNGQLSWIPPQDGSSEWIAEKGDNAWTLHEQSGIPYDEVISNMKSQGYAFSNNDKYVSLQPGDKVKLGSNDNINFNNINNIENIENTNTGRGFVLSVLNLSLSIGPGIMIDMGAVTDATGNASLYFTYGFMYGLSATAGMGLSVTDKDFKATDLAGSALNVSFKLPFIKNNPISIELNGDLSPYNKIPGKNTRYNGINIGLGSGYFIGKTNTLLIEPSPSDVWNYHMRHF